MPILVPPNGSLVTLDDYQRITHDTTSSEDDVTDALAAAQDLVAEYIRRPNRLAHGTYTDRLRLYLVDGIRIVYPIATPVASAANGLTVLDGRAVAGAWTDDSPLIDGILGVGTPPYATVTYTGGWTEVTLPETVRREIAKTARLSLQPSTLNVPVGATSVRVGDVAVGFGSSAAAGAELTDASRKALRRYVRRRAA